MINPEPIGWANTGLPLAVLVAGAVVLPRLFSDANSLSQRRLKWAILLTVLSLIGLGALIFAGVYAWGGAGVGAAFNLDGLATVLFFLRLSLKSALLWGPVLLLVWFVMAQGVEKRRGEEIVRRRIQ